MGQDPNYKAIFVILNDIESHGLVQFNEEFFDEEFFRNFVEFEKSFSHSISEIISRIDSFQTNHEEMSIFAIYCEFSYIYSHLEAIKKFLKIIINPTKLKGGFDENTTLEQMIKRVCNKMQYSEKLKNSIRGLFLEDLREAAIHQNYRIYENGNLVIHPNNEKLKKQLNIKDLVDYSVQVMTIFDAMIDWSDGKEKTVDKKNEPIDRIIRELIKQVELLDRKLDRLS